MPAVATAGGVPSRLGKYELLLPLAAGGMARIYIARSTGIGSFERHVVLKMITPERANDVTAVTMFLDEARLAASLNHQNVGQVFEVGEDAGIHYLAMEYVHGQDLRALLAKAGSEGTRIPLELALTVVAGAAAGLHHAHERRGPDGLPIGIVHRDVSPSNIMIGYDGAVKLLDFGIAKATARSVETQSGIIKGKFAYMAPEQCRGRDVDRRSDVFSLGIILYEISTQHRCFRADSDFDTMHRIVTGDVVRPTRLVHGYPQALEAIVMKALAIDAAQRYQSAGLLLEALESFAVSSRMSLSTMGLGRFMRDMFGEVQEPWLSPPATKSVQPIAAKESTISTTNGQGSQAHPVGEAPSASAHEDDMGFPDSSGINSAARTTFAMRGERDENEADPHMPSASYSAASALGTTRPSQQMPAQRPSQSVPAQRPSHPHVVVMPLEGRATPTSGPHLKAYPSGTTPPPDLAKVPTHQFNSPITASGSGTSHPAIGIPGTKQGYTSGVMTRNEASYPRYQAPVEVMTGNVHLTPNRRPLLIGTGIVAAGVAVMLMVSLSGSGDDTIAPTDDPTHQVSDPASPGPATRKPDDTDVADDNMVSVVIHSDPAGADVLIAGAKVGITPFESKLKRGTKITPLTVQKDGYAPFAGKIDLGGEYENRNIKLVRVEDLPKGSDAKPPGEKDKGTTDGTDVGPTTNGDTGSRMGAEKLKPDAEKGENSEKARTEKSGSEKSGSEKSGSEKSGSEKSGSKTSSEKTGAEKSASRSSVDRTSSKASFEKSGSERSSPEKSVIERPSADKTNSERASSDKTGSEKAAPVKKEKCQPPGPNVDPFGPPICKT